MEYIVVNIVLRPPDESVAEIFSAILGELGYSSFEFNTEGLNAYIQASAFSGEELKKVLDPVQHPYSFSWENLPDINWNAEWEKHYEPVTILNTCHIHASFHSPRSEYPINIQIQPQMAFGTGHHATTKIMVEALLSAELSAKRILDVGTGTGILSILAEKLGAREILGIDIDEWACRNASENLKLNGSKNIAIQMGSIESLPPSPYDVIIANINRNVILSQLSYYSSFLISSGLLLISGFLKEDSDLVLQHTVDTGFKMEKVFSEDLWVGMVLRKQN